MLDVCALERQHLVWKMIMSSSYNKARSLNFCFNGYDQMITEQIYGACLYIMDLICQIGFVYDLDERFTMFSLAIYFFSHLFSSGCGI